VPCYAVCGEVPEHPVVSTKTGHIFEKRLITKYIEAEGKCPITGEPLELTDLLDVQANRVSLMPLHTGRAT
jgi:pre-mRNA-processing factor 19